MRPMTVSEEDLRHILSDLPPSGQEGQRRQDLLDQADELGRVLGPLTTARLRAGIPLPLPGLRQPAHD